jgi:hypothetical protein
MFVWLIKDKITRLNPTHPTYPIIPCGISCIVTVSFEFCCKAELQLKEAEIANQTEIFLKAESESQQVNAENTKLKCENDVLLQNLDIMMKDGDDLKLQCNDLKKSYDTKL